MQPKIQARQIINLSIFSNFLFNEYRSDEFKKKNDELLYIGLVTRYGPCTRRF